MTAAHMNADRLEPAGQASPAPSVVGVRGDISAEAIRNAAPLLVRMVAKHRERLAAERGAA